MLQLVADSLKRTPRVLFLGQSYLARETTSDPQAIALGGDWLSSSVHRAWLSHKEPLEVKAKGLNESGRVVLEVPRFSRHLVGYN